MTEKSVTLVGGWGEWGRERGSEKSLLVIWAGTSSYSVSTNSKQVVRRQVLPGCAHISK